MRKRSYSFIKGLLVIALVGMLCSCGSAKIEKDTNGQLVSNIQEKDQGNTTEYKYRFELTGRMPNAECDTTFVVDTNNPKLSFEQVSQSILSSQYVEWDFALVTK